MALLVLLAFLLVAASVAGYGVWAMGASGPRTPVTIEIPEGATASDVAELLADQDVIRSSLAFRVIARIRGIGSEIQAGDYSLTTNMRVSEVIDALEQGPLEPNLLTTTIPEGFTVRQVAERATEDLELSSDEFIVAATSGSYRVPPYLPSGAETVEGFLFPKTYEFEPGVDVDAVIERLLDQFREEVDGLPWDRARQLGVTPYEIVVIASMIEREAGVPQDRQKIAAVIYNRLEQGMLLQIDATVLYILPEHREPTPTDFDIDSPYNTYLHAGLPPTPIANPGRAAIAAALSPADVDFLFYVLADCGGRHAFARTLEEHNRLKAQSPDCG
ncbi:MAG: endolytic transglycosylase MltG [Actinomycetota bacterium]